MVVGFAVGAGRLMETVMRQEYVSELRQPCTECGGMAREYAEREGMECFCCGGTGIEPEMCSDCSAAAEELCEGLPFCRPCADRMETE